MPHGTVEERRANIIGWAYAPFRMNDLMHGIHGEHAGDLDIEIYDGQEASPPALMYDSEPSAPAVRSGRTALTSLTTIRIAGYPWTIYIRGLKGIYGRIDGKRPLLIAAAGFVISLLLTWLTWVLVKAREQAVKAVQEREKLIAELQKAMAEIKTLQGIIPICSSCKKIREEDGAWRQMEAYIHDHTDAEFSHGLCQECAKRLYGEYLK